MSAGRTMIGRALGWGSLAAGVPWAAYHGALTASAWVAVAQGRHRTALPVVPTTRFVVLVPAHDEERLIAETLDSMAALDYPADLVTVHVVADNCHDRTADIVRAHGCRVHERHDPEHGGKGPALHWLLQRLWAADDPHDAVVIVDADTTVSPNLLRVADAKLRAGAQVVQAHYAVRDAGTSTATAFRAGALAVRHYLRPLGRNRLGASAGLYGNGMVFAHQVLRARTFSDHLVEDIEFQLELLLQGTRVEFAPDATVEAEMPDTLEGSRTQHERWERGRLEMARRFLGPLATRSARGGPAGRVAYVDAVCDQVVPPFSLVVAATGASVIAGAAGAALGRRRGGAILAIALGALAVQVAYVLSGLKMVRAPRAVYRALLAAPRLVLWKLRLWLRMLARPTDVSWVRTARNADAGDTDR